MGCPDLNLLLEENEPFILRTASRVTGRILTKSDDEYSIALSAFWEASQTYDPGKGTLQAYAAVVIRHRLIDACRAQRKYDSEVAVEPAVFSGETVEGSEALQRSVEATLLRLLSSSDLREEIQDLSKLLEKYHIDFFDLPSCSPKARKTRRTCLRASRFVCRFNALLLKLRRTLKLPASDLEHTVPSSRKLMEKFRKYIITSVEIEAGDFPSLQAYFPAEEAE